MKSAYELAMERLRKEAPSVTLTLEQKKALAELDSVYAAKIAERDLFLQDQRARAEAQGDFDSVGQIETQIAREKRALQADLEEKKEAIRAGSGST